MPTTIPANYTLPQNASLCVLRLSAIGDVCHAASMVSRIRRSRPDVRVVWIIGKIEYQLMQGMQGVEFIVFDKKSGKQAVQAVRKQLNGRKFDALCVMQVALRANWLSRHIKAKIRLGFDKAHSKEGHTLFINRRIHNLKHPHVLEGFHAFADALGIPAIEPLHFDISLSAEDEQIANQVLKEYGDYVVICPAASKLERSWLVSRYAEVIEHCSSLGFCPVLCGGPGELDRTLASQIEKACSTPPVSLVGKTTLKQMLAVLKHANLVISPDTGPAHMATSVNTPVIGLYAHSNPLRTGPYLSLDCVVSTYNANIQVQYNNHWQSLRWGTRAKGGDLMSGIQTSDVIEKINFVLNTDKT